MQKCKYYTCELRNGPAEEQQQQQQQQQQQRRGKAAAAGAAATAAAPAAAKVLKTPSSIYMQLRCKHFYTPRSLRFRRPRRMYAAWQKCLDLIALLAAVLPVTAALTTYIGPGFPAAGDEPEASSGFVSPARAANTERLLRKSSRLYEHVECAHTAGKRRRRRTASHRMLQWVVSMTSARTRKG